MSERHYFTDQEKAELLSNIYTARVTDCKIIFTLAFKQFVMENIDKPNMTASKVFELAGYRKEMFNPRRIRYFIQAIRDEAASADGLKEAKAITKNTPRKKHSETEFKELQDRVTNLEQQVNFLKKSQHLKRMNRLKPPTSSS